MTALSHDCPMAVTLQVLGRVLINRQPNADLDGLLMSAFGAKADMVRVGVAMPAHAGDA
jgi:hypothetical protein